VSTNDDDEGEEASESLEDEEKTASFPFFPSTQVRYSPFLARARRARPRLSSPELEKNTNESDSTRREASKASPKKKLLARWRREESDDGEKSHHLPRHSFSGLLTSVSSETPTSTEPESEGGAMTSRRRGSSSHFSSTEE